MGGRCAPCRRATSGPGAASPTPSTLAPCFPDGRPRRLDPWLGSIIEPLSAYSAGLARNPLAYYLESGRDQVSLPFSLYMTAGVVGALRWGDADGECGRNATGRLPERLHPAEDFTGASEAAARVSLQLTRLNQASLALIDAVTPGTTAATLTSAAPPSTR